jgi:hypothetical protein
MHYQFRDAFRRLRASVSDPTEAFFVLHSPVGELRIAELNYSISGCVFVGALDTDSKWRYLLFAEDQILAMPIEVKWRTRTSPGNSIGFGISTKPEDMDSVPSDASHAYEY